MTDYIKREDAVRYGCELLIENGGCTACSERQSGCDSVRDFFAKIPAADVIETSKIPDYEILKKIHGW